ncbi:hypothetical protein H5410_048060 [Solanum commersonii]|uniref:Uncharacterized protein n=1 Tax=Solanum commersonii TaxID=4109 RepID=A0A9J5XIV3_SOLCO|nr:hypothetical protein H5410_048060 [Solanum commersonii]
MVWTCEKEVHRHTNEEVQEIGYESPSSLYRDLLYLSGGFSQTVSLPPRGSSKAYMHSTLFIPHLWNYTEYVVVATT